jgi:hypothetical protein
VVADASEYPDPSDYTRNDIFVKIEDEICGVDAVNTSTNTLTIDRAQWETTAASHNTDAKVEHVACFGVDNGTDAPTGKAATEVLQDLLEWADPATSVSVNTASFDDVKDGAWPESSIVKKITKSRTVAEHMTELREPRGLLVYINESGEFACSVMAPDASPTSLTEDNALRDSVSVREDQEERITRASVWYDPQEEGSNEPEDYAKVVIVVDAELESDNFYGDVREEALTDAWIDPVEDIATIRNMCRRLISRKGGGVFMYEFELELKDAALAVGDTAHLTSRYSQQPDGSNATRAIKILAKKQVSESRYRYKGVTFGRNLRYLRIGPDTMATDYDSASADDRSYGYWSDSDGRVGGTKEVGYRYW